MNNSIRVLILACFAATARSDKLLKATAYWDSTHKAVLLKEGVLDPQGDAYGYYNDTLSSTGWGVLEIHAGYGQTAEPDDVTMFTAGYLEGFLTAPQIFDHYTNMYPQVIQNPKVLGPVKRFMAKQDEWSRAQVKRNTSDPLWIHTGLILAQLDGLQAGVTDWAKKQGRTVRRSSLDDNRAEILNWED